MIRLQRTNFVMRLLVTEIFCIRINNGGYLAVQVCILMRSNREVMSGQRCHPLTHLLLDEQHLHSQRDTCRTVLAIVLCVMSKHPAHLQDELTSCFAAGTLSIADSLMCCNLFVSSLVQISLPAHLGSAPVAERLLRKAAAALDVFLPLEERRELGLQDLHSGKWEMRGRRDTKEQEREERGRRGGGRGSRNH